MISCSPSFQTVFTQTVLTASGLKTKSDSHLQINETIIIIYATPCISLQQLSKDKLVIYNTWSEKR